MVTHDVFTGIHRVTQQVKGEIYARHWFKSPKNDLRHFR